MQKDFHHNPESPSVSVIIPAYNEADFIRRALDSLLKQDCQNFELIVVNNNSTDDTAEIARNYGAVVIREPKQGVAKARQAGFLVAKAGIIATTDADTKLPSDWISKIIKQFNDKPNLVAYGGVYSLHSGPKLARWLFPKKAYWLWLMDKKLSGSWSLPGANMAVRKTAFAQVGGFNPELNLGEDADLSHRLSKIGKVLLDKKFLVSTSGRRYRKGLLAAAYAYLPNIASRTLLNKQTIKNKLPAIRKESMSPLAFVAPIFTLTAMSVLFFHNPVSAKAGKMVIHNGQRMVLAAGQMVHRHHLHFRVNALGSASKIHGT